MNRSESPKILIVEDDAEQMALFTSITLEEIETVSYTHLTLPTILLV